MTNPDQPEEEKATASQNADNTPTCVNVPTAEYEQIKQDAEVYRDKYLRLLAETDNIRKRLQKEKVELTQYAVQSVIIDFLNPIDHLENALKHTQQASDEVKHWAFGFQMILNQFKDVLANNGVVPFESVGTPFDPHIHEAIEMIATDEYPPGVVITEIVRGYKMKDKIIRPARVKVTKSQKTEEEK